MSDSFENEISSKDETEDIFCPTNQPGPSKPLKRGNINFINTELVAALDKCKLSDRDSVHILIATTEALGHNTEDLVINRTSIRRCRQKLRAERASVLKNKRLTLQLEFGVVHWDGKLLPAITGNEKVDRLPVIISAKGQEHFLGVPQLVSSSGDMAAAIYNLLAENQLLDTVEALCCDTTASNTGRIKGACVLLERKLEKDLLCLPCRHHIYELVLKSAFEACIATSSGPEAGLFKRFQHAWANIDVSKYTIGIDDQFVRNSIGKDIEIMLHFAKEQVFIQQTRDDYKELLQLVITFLGGHEVKAIKFRLPGAFHHARWMTKATYCLKIFIFRNEFNLTRQEFKGLGDICIFIVKIYIKVWYNAPLACKALSQDLMFLKDLYFYNEINEKISQATTKKFCGHLWYLTEETVALAFFDNTIPLEQKIKMAKAFKEKESNNCDSKRLNFHLEEMTEFTHKELHNFVSKSTSNFFKRFKISSDFIARDPVIWNSLHDYQHGLTIVRNLTVVNDTAERGVKLMEEYNNLITHDEEQKQYLL